jgi:putative membrane protein
MIADHTANTQRLMQTVEAGGGKMEAPSKLDERHEQMVEQLEGASDDQFDAMYLQGQVQAHQEAVALMTGYSQNGDNEALQKFAAQALPVVQMHYEMVQKMAQGSM